MHSSFALMFAPFHLPSPSHGTATPTVPVLERNRPSSASGSRLCTAVMVPVRSFGFIPTTGARRTLRRPTLKRIRGCVRAYMAPFVMEHDLGASLIFCVG